MQEAFAIDLQKWTVDGLLNNPRAWLISTARFKAIEQIRLIFTCFHPVLAEPARLALTLREVFGMTTEAVARAFYKSPARWHNILFVPKTKSVKQVSCIKSPMPISCQKG